MRYKMLMRSDELLAELEEALVHHHGDLSEAAAQVEASPAAVHFWMEDDPNAAARLRIAQQVGWTRLESAAYQRGVLGVTEDVYFKGEVVGQRKVYSDGLLSQMLKARNPAYRQEQESGPRVVVNLMPRASTYEEWVGMRSSALAHMEQQRLEHKPVEVEWEPVTESALKDVL